MPQHTSAEKQVRIGKKANLRNRTNRSQLRTVIRKVLESKDKNSAQEAYRTAASLIDKSVGSGLIHRNNAANKKSRLSAFIEKLAQ